MWIAAALLPTSSASVPSLLGLGTFEKLRGKALYRKRATEEQLSCVRNHSESHSSHPIEEAILGGASRGRKESEANVMVCANRLPQTT